MKVYFLIVKRVGNGWENVNCKNWTEIAEQAKVFIQFLQGDNFLVSLIHRIKIILSSRTLALQQIIAGRNL